MFKKTAVLALALALLCTTVSFSFAAQAEGEVVTVEVLRGSWEIGADEDLMASTFSTPRWTSWKPR